MQIIVISILFLLFCGPNVLAAPPQNYLYTSSGQLEKLQALLARPDIDGVPRIQIISATLGHNGEVKVSC